MTRSLVLRLAAWQTILALWFVSSVALGHEIDSAWLSLTEVSAGSFALHWRADSTTFVQDLEQSAVFPGTCRRRGEQLDCGAAGLCGTIRFPWIEGSRAHVMVQIDWRNGASLLRVVDGRSPTLSVYGDPTSSGWRYLKSIAIDYTRLGVEHILTGYDHLLFVLALTILVRNGKRLIATITAFTVAHSVTLAATVFGWFSLAAAPVETAIALSIVLVCAECLRPRDSLARRMPWLVAFAFGLLHGLGFASSLLAIGLPEKHLPSALVFFNLGVEFGQLGAIALVMLTRRLLARLLLPRNWWRPVLVYAMGSVAAFWSLERGFAMFGQ